MTSCKYTELELRIIMEKLGEIRQQIPNGHPTMNPNYIGHAIQVCKYMLEDITTEDAP